MTEEPPRNELIRRLLSKLTPEGREAWEALEWSVADSAPGDDIEKIMEPELSRLASLPKQDQEIVGRLFDYHLRSLQADIEQSERKRALFDREMWILHRGYELLDSEGEGRWPDTLEEAITILERHGERPPPLP